jgi:hypothetical protein
VLAVIGRWARGEFDGADDHAMSVTEVADLTWALVRGAG